MGKTFYVYLVILIFLFTPACTTVTTTPESIPSQPISSQTSIPLANQAQSMYDMFPIQPGSQWVYRYESQTCRDGGDGSMELSIQGIFERKVERVERLQGSTITVVRITRTGGPSLPFQIETPSTDYEWLVMNEHILYQTKDRTSAIELALQLRENPELRPTDWSYGLYLLFPIPDDSWPLSPEDGLINDYNWNAMPAPEVQTVAGNFQGCYRIFLATLPDYTEYTFCPGIGSVGKYYQHSTCQTYREELISFQIVPPEEAWCLLCDSNQ